MASPFKLLRETGKADRLPGPAARAGAEDLRLFQQQHWNQSDEPYQPPIPGNEIPGDVLRSIPSGLRSGAEGLAGMGGDAGNMQRALADYLAKKLGGDPGDASKVLNMLPGVFPGISMPDSEQTTALSSKLFGDDPVTRYEPRSPWGQASNLGANMAVWPERSMVTGPAKGLRALKGAM